MPRIWRGLVRRLVPMGPRLAAVGCAPRTGSTLLTRILDSHSKIAAPCEIALPRYFPPEDEKRALVEEKLDQISDFYGVSRAAARSDAELLLRRILRRERKKLLILKDPRQSLFLNGLISDFSGVRLIHLVREARSVAANRMFASDPGFGLRRWLEYNEAVLAATASLPRSRWIRLRYEDLVKEPSRVISVTVGFLGFEFEPAILDYGRFSHADDRMRLWAGSPGESPLQQTLQGGTIREVEDDETTRNDVERAFSSMPAVRRLNEFLGYGPATESQNI